MPKNNKSIGVSSLENLKSIEIDTKQSEYTLKDEEKKVLAYCLKRKSEMANARRAVDKNWSLYQDMIDAIFEEYPDERSSSTVPLASALIELYVADATTIKTDFRFRGEGAKNKVRAKTMETVRKYDWRTEKRQKTFDEAEYTAAGYGTQIMTTGFEIVETKQKNMTIGEDGKASFEEVTIKEENIIIKELDIRHVYIDNHAKKDIEEASDYCYDERISLEKFKLLKENPLYSNIDAVGSVDMSNESNTFLTEEEKSKNGDFVKITHYRNVDKDRYVCYANDSVIIRAHPIMETIRGKKALNISVRRLGKKNRSVYGRGICEACLMFNSEINNLREMLMDGIRRSNTQTLAIGNGLSFDGRKFSYDNEILLFDGQFNGNFQQISGNPPNQAIFSYVDRIYKDIAVYIGIDIQNIVGEPSQTAYQTEVQRVASQKRVGLWLKNRDYAYERIADLHMENLQKFFPIKTYNGISPELETEGEIYDEKEGKYKKKKGTHPLKVTKEMLEGPVLVDVFTNTSTPTIDVVKKSLALELLTTLSKAAVDIANAQAGGLDINEFVPLKPMIDSIVDGYDLNLPENIEREELDKKKKEVKQELIAMKEGTNLPPTVTSPGPEQQNQSTLPSQQNSLSQGREEARPEGAIAV